jgi:hypothetical protein
MKNTYFSHINNSSFCDILTMSGFTKDNMMFFGNIDGYLGLDNAQGRTARDLCI